MEKQLATPLLSATHLHDKQGPTIAPKITKLSLSQLTQNPLRLPNFTKINENSSQKTLSKEHRDQEKEEQDEIFFWTKWIKK